MVVAFRGEFPTLIEFFRAGGGFPPFESSLREEKEFSENIAPEWEDFFNKSGSTVSLDSPQKQGF